MKSSLLISAFFMFILLVLCLLFQALYVPDSLAHAMQGNASDLHLFVVVVGVLLTSYVLNLLVCRGFGQDGSLYLATGAFALLASHVCALINHLVSVPMVIAFSGLSFVFFRAAIVRDVRLKGNVLCYLLISAGYMFWVNFLSDVEIASVYLLILMLVYLAAGLIFGLMAGNKVQ
jgi:hypothetical protein